MKVGAHVSIAGGVEKAPQRAANIGAECFQMFASSPRSWRAFPILDDEITAFRAERERLGLGPVFFHSIYLLNLAARDADLRKKSIDSLAAYLDLSYRMGVEGVITHTGSHGGGGIEHGLHRAAASIKEVLRRSHRSSRLCLENTAGGGDTIGRSFEGLAKLLGLVGSDRLFVCVDTAHAFESGYDISSVRGVRATVERFRAVIGADRLAVVHANDSKTPLGSNADRHENIGDGFIGQTGFRALMRDSLFGSVPWILEVPGTKGDGPDAGDIRRLKRLRANPRKRK